MSSPSSPTLDKVVENIMEEVTVEVEVEAGEARVFLSDKGAEAFKKSLAKKGFFEERGFRGLVTPFKEEVKRK